MYLKGDNNALCFLAQPYVTPSAQNIKLTYSFIKKTGEGRDTSDLSHGKKLAIKQENFFMVHNWMKSMF